jgi:hypothetical protein
MADILSELRAENTEQSELETLLLGYFGQGSHTAENELSFGRAGEDCCLKLRYNDVGALVAIDEGPGLRPDDIQTLQQKVGDELLSTGPMTTVRRVLFASVPTDAAFRYKNEFQMLPVPPEAPVRANLLPSQDGQGDQGSHGYLESRRAPVSSGVSLID